MTVVTGHVGGDPEIRATAGGTSVATFSIATTDVWKDKATGERKERTDWHRIKLFAGLADVAKDYVKKGSLVQVQGSPRSDRYTDSAGVERYSHEVIGDKLFLLDRAEPSGGDNGGERDE